MLPNKDHQNMIYEEDREMFNEMVTKENILKNIEENGSFSITYRTNTADGAKYICLKAVKDRKDGKHIIIGINKNNIFKTYFIVNKALKKPDVLQNSLNI